MKNTNKNTNNNNIKLSRFDQFAKDNNIIAINEAKMAWEECKKQIFSELKNNMEHHYKETGEDDVYSYGESYNDFDYIDFDVIKKIDKEF